MSDQRARESVSERTRTGAREDAVSIHDYASGPCPLRHFSTGCGGDCPEPVRCAIDRAVEAVGPCDRIVIDHLTYEARRG